VPETTKIDDSPICLSWLLFNTSPL
jgi:hypothetical protein